MPLIGAGTDLPIPFCALPYPHLLCCYGWCHYRRILPRLVTLPAGDAFWTAFVTALPVCGGTQRRFARFLNALL